MLAPFEWVLLTPFLLCLVAIIMFFIAVRAQSDYEKDLEKELEKETQ